MENAEPAEKVVKVVEPKASKAKAVETRLINLENTVLALSESTPATSTEEMQQELRNAGELMVQAIQALRAMTPRIEKLERQCQSLGDRPVVRNCKHCQTKLDARVTHCPSCGQAAR